MWTRRTVPFRCLRQRTQMMYKNSLSPVISLLYLDKWSLRRWHCIQNSTYVAPVEIFGLHYIMHLLILSYINLWFIKLLHVLPRDNTEILLVLSQQRCRMILFSYRFFGIIVWSVIHITLHKDWLTIGYWHVFTSWSTLILKNCTLDKLYLDLHLILRLNCRFQEI